jgi:hypothetical protein
MTRITPSATVHRVDVDVHRVDVDVHRVDVDVHRVDVDVHRVDAYWGQLESPYQGTFMPISVHSSMHEDAPHARVSGPNPVPGLHTRGSAQQVPLASAAEQTDESGTLKLHVAAPGHFAPTKPPHGAAPPPHSPPALTAAPRRAATVAFQ